MENKKKKTSQKSSQTKFTPHVSFLKRRTPRNNAFIQSHPHEPDETVTLPNIKKKGMVARRQEEKEDSTAAGVRMPADTADEGIVGGSGVAAGG